MANIPESLRKQQVAAGKKRAPNISHEDRVRGGKNSWLMRLKKARDAEALAKRKAQPVNIAPRTKGIF